MKKFKRNKDSYLMVIEDVNLWYRVGLFESNEDEADYIYEAKFETERQAEIVCEMLVQEYGEGHNDGRIFEESIQNGE